MIVLKDFHIFADNRAKVLRTMDVKDDSPCFDEMCDLFNSLSNEAVELISPVAVYDIRPNTFSHLNRELDACEFTALCLYSIGGKISERVTGYFRDGLYPEGMMLDHIADYLIGECDRYLCDTLLRDLSLRKLGITGRLEPADHIPPEYSGYIAEKLDALSLGISVTSGHMLNPVKSGAFILGCDKSLPLGNVKHDCSKCKLVDCKWRNL